MPLDITKLERVCPKDDGRIIARCPACAQSGHDHTGNHLVVFPDGQFSCVAYPGASGKEHRRQIYALVGEGEQQAIIPIELTTFSLPPAKRVVIGRFTTR